MGRGGSSLLVLLMSVVLGIAIVSTAGVGVEPHDCNVSSDEVGVWGGGSSLFDLLTSVVFGVAIVSTDGVGVEIPDCNVSCGGTGVGRFSGLGILDVSSGG